MVVSTPKSGTKYPAPMMGVALSALWMGLLSPGERTGFHDSRAMAGARLLSENNDEGTGDSSEGSLTGPGSGTMSPD